MEGGRGGLPAWPFALSSCRYVGVDDHIHRLVVVRSRRELAKRLDTSTDAAQKMREGFVRNGSAARRRRIHTRRVVALRAEPLISPFLPILSSHFMEA